MTFQTTEPLENRNLEAQKRRVKAFVDDYDEGRLFFDETYQRGAVWTNDQRIRLMRSWITGSPIQAICINLRDGALWGYDYTGPEYAVVDGRQRMETAIAWFHNELAVPVSWFKPEDIANPDHVVDTDDGPYVTIKGLSSARRGDLDRQLMLLPVVETRVGSVEEEAGLYALLEQSGTAQDAAHMERVLRVANRLGGNA